MQDLFEAGAQERECDSYNLNEVVKNEIIAGVNKVYI